MRLKRQSPGKLRLPELRPLESLLLRVSFQRYALLLAAAAAALPVGLWLAGVSALAAWLAALVASLAIGARALEVGRRGPAKLHALRVALHRLERGTFAPEQIRRHCGDPCFRLVADESLRRAGLPRRARRGIIQGYARALRDERSALVVIDHVRGELRQTIGGVTSQHRLAVPAARAQPAESPVES